MVQTLRSGVVVVGRKAYEQHPDRLTGRCMGRCVKLQMGKAAQTLSLCKAAGVERSPEEVSAEILKLLRADAEAWTGEARERAAITVPAMFKQTQAEATQRAAALAGIEQAPLLQEPIAAGLAHGYDRDIDPRILRRVPISAEAPSTSLSCRCAMGGSALSARMAITISADAIGTGDSQNLLVERLVDQGYAAAPPLGTTLNCVATAASSRSRLRRKRFGFRVRSVLTLFSTVESRMVKARSSRQPWSLSHARNSKR